VGSKRSCGRGLALLGVAFLLGKGGNAQSRFDVRSGDGGAIDRVTGVVTLRVILKGDFGGAANRGDRLLGSLRLLIDDGSNGRNGLSS
jgi:hypothetical protein